MKQFFAASLCGVIIAFILFSCFGRHHHGDLGVTVSDSDNTYKIVAEFDESKDRDVERFLNDQLHERTTMSFVNTTIDGDLTLDDKTSFYIKKKPGYLTIKVDKRKNSIASYYAVKELGQKLKSALADN